MYSADVYKLMEGTADAAFAVTLGGEICFWNRSAEQLFGYSAAEVLNKTCDEVLQGTGSLGTLVCRQGCGVQCSAAHTDSIPTFDLEVSTGSGKRIWVSVSTIVFEDSRLHRRVVVHLSRDISRRKETEQAFAQMLELSRHVIAIGECQPAPMPVEALSDQQQRILMLFAKAKNSAQVAKELGITLPTLRNHLHAINQKLRTHNRLEAVLHAMRRGLIHP
jgi:PAS domain S-box-containing protein